MYLAATLSAIEFATKAVIIFKSSVKGLEAVVNTVSSIRDVYLKYKKSQRKKARRRSRSYSNFVIIQYPNFV